MGEHIRDLRIDGIKYFLIILVIVGHYIEPSRYLNTLSLNLYSLIYFFHMPLFVMISGYFCGNQRIEKIKVFTIKILEIIFIVQLVQFLVYRPRIVTLFFFSSNPLWFLLCLIYWKVYSYILDRVGFSLKRQALISFALAVLFFCCINKYEGLFSISRAFQFLPYFSVGRLLHDNPVRINISASVLFVVSAFILCLLLSSRELHEIEFQREGLVSLSSIINLNLYSSFILKVLYWLLSMIVSITLLEHLRLPTVFEKNGSRTLAIFVFQCYTYPLVVRFVGEFYLELFCALVSIVCFTYLANKEKFSSFITNPVSSIIHFFNRYR